MRHRVDIDEAWEYTEQTGVHDWAVSHVVAATIAGALVWFAILYTLTLIIDAVV